MNDNITQSPGYFGDFGGVFVAETLAEPLKAVEKAYEKFQSDSAVQAQLRSELADFVGRPSPPLFR